MPDRNHLAAPPPRANSARDQQKRAWAERSIHELLERHHARVVLLIDDQGAVAAWRSGIHGEDLRQEIITAANFVRNAVEKKGSL